MKIKTSELTGAALDWAVAKAERVINGDNLDVGFILEKAYSPSTDWAQGGTIIEREKIGIVTSDDDANIWVGSMFEPDWKFSRTGNTPLIAAMRGYVAGKMGDEIEIPEELK